MKDKKKQPVAIHKSLKQFNQVTLFYMSLSMLMLSILLTVFNLVLQKPDKAIVSPPQGFSVNQLVTSGQVEAKINSVSYSSEAPGFKAPDGQKYMIIDLNVKNISNEPINVLPSIDTYVKTAGGTVIYLTPFNVSSPFRAGTLASGDQIHGQLTYLVSSTESSKFYIDSKWSGTLLIFGV